MVAEYKGKKEKEHLTRIKWAVETISSSVSNNLNNINISEVVSLSRFSNFAARSDNWTIT